MKAENKIVFMDGGLPSIIFPVGLPKDGGSCAYLSEHCLQYCPAKETNKHEVRALKFFKDNNSKIIVNKIIEEVCQEAMIHLYWWSWGDCLPELVDKITDVMWALSGTGILQNGFTRNNNLWRNVNFPQTDNLRIGFHVDTIKEIKIFEKWRVVCCPDVEVGKAELYFNGEKIARCCGIWCDWIQRGETRMADCQECYCYKQGCFIGLLGK